MSHLSDKLEIMAFHLTELWNTPPGKTFKAGLSQGDLFVMVEIQVQERRGIWTEADRVWDGHIVNGRNEGNRCGARNALARLYAPVLAAAAAEDARVAAQEQAA